MISKLVKDKISTWKDNSEKFIYCLSDGRSVSKNCLREIIYELANLLSKDKSENKKIIGLYFEDPKNYLVSILSSIYSDNIYVPIPKEFSLEQISSFVPNIDYLITDHENELLSQFEFSEKFIISNGFNLEIYKAKKKGFRFSPAIQESVISIIHTSGSSGNPKGSVISDKGLWLVTHEMSKLFARSVKYYSILPYSLLLEQVLGLFMPLLSDGSMYVQNASQRLYTGTQDYFDIYLDEMRNSTANFTMVPPSFLIQLSNRTESIAPIINSSGEDLVVATGGAPIPESTLIEFQNAGVRLFQGYGLSENSSVVSWNYPGPNKIGSAGKILSHNFVKIENDEILLKSEAKFLGYIQNGKFLSNEEEWLFTGDIGRIDRDGYLYIEGRVDNLIVMSNGRNISPEWIEAKIKSIKGVKESLVIKNKTGTIDLILFKEIDADEELINCSLEEIVNHMPKYIEVNLSKIVPFSNDYFSVSGRIKRSYVSSNLNNNGVEYERRS